MSKKKGGFFIKVGLLLIVAALVLTGYNLWDDYRAGKAAEDVLAKLSLQIGQPSPNENSGLDSLDNIEYPDYVLNPNTDLPTVTIDGQKFVGILELPTENKKFPIFDSWSYANLKTSACRYSGTPYLNDFVICGHNYIRHFGPINNLKYGDPVIFTDVDGNVFRYEVGEVERLSGNAVEAMKSSEWDLTLFTCTLSGNARVTVRCQTIDNK